MSIGEDLQVPRPGFSRTHLSSLSQVLLPYGACQPSEESYTVRDIDGVVPAFIRGTYYLNGPGRFARAGLDYRHWLDGDGMVCALRFDNDSVQFTNRFVRSTKFVAEEEACRPMFRAFGTSFEGDLLKRRIAVESPVNVSVYPYRNSLLAFGEQGLPWELDPVTLETRGEYNFGGAINDISPFAAHPFTQSWPQSGQMFIVYVLEKGSFSSIGA